MSDFLIFAFITAFAYCFSLVGIEQARKKSGKVRCILIVLIIAIFSVLNGWAMSINEDKIPIDFVEKEWDRYVIDCKQNHISWNELTFPEWLSIESELQFEEYVDR